MAHICVPAGAGNRLYDHSDNVIISMNIYSYSNSIRSAVLIGSISDPNIVSKFSRCVHHASHWKMVQIVISVSADLGRPGGGAGCFPKPAV